MDSLIPEQKNKFLINNHTLFVSREDNYVKFTIINPKNVIYENKTHLYDLKSPFGNDYTYGVFFYCLKKVPNYSFSTAFKDDIYHLKFETLIGNYEVKFLIKNFTS